MRNVGIGVLVLTGVLLFIASTSVLLVNTKDASARSTAAPPDVTNAGLIEVTSEDGTVLGKYVFFQDGPEIRCYAPQNRAGISCVRR